MTSPVRMRPPRCIRQRFRGRPARFGALLALAALPVLAGPGPGAFAEGEEQQLEQIEEQAKQAADDIGVRDAEADAAAARLADVTAQVGAAERALQDAQRDLTTARAELGRRQQELARAQSAERAAQQEVDRANEAVEAARQELRDMLRNAYQQGVGTDLDALMTGGTPDDLADRIGLLDQIAKERDDRIDALAAARDVLADKERQLSEARQRAGDAVSAADAQVTSVARAVSAAAEAATQIKQLQAERQQALVAAVQAVEAARARYAALQAAQARIEAALAARASAPAMSGGRPGAGGLVMPTTGLLSSVFGFRNDPFGGGGRKFHAGQDIAAPEGAPIYAATAGTVAILQGTATSGGYGNYTCIDRGAGFATCYAHQSRVVVRVGQVVQQGQLIGYVGNTGHSTGAHLHFEVRINGKPVDPAPYLR